MGNGYYQQFMFSKTNSPVLLQGSIAIGGGGAVGTVTGSGIVSVTRLSAGTLRIVLEEPYPRLCALHMNAIAPTTGAAVADGAFVVGTTYQITVVGTTNWQTAGLPAGVTAAVGMSFVAIAVGGAGTGTATAVGQSGVSSAEVVGNPQVMVSVNALPHIIIQTVDDAGAVADAASGSVLELMILLRNSSVKGRNE